MTRADLASNPAKWHRLGDLPLQWTEWLIEDILPRGQTACLFGRRGIGKTFLALDFALCAASGTPWLGKRTAEPVKVVYLLAEAPEGIRRRAEGWLRLKAQQGETIDLLRAHLDENLLIAPMPLALDAPDELETLLDKLDGEKPVGLVVLDPLVSFMRGNENDTRAMQGLVDALRRIVTKIGCTVLAVHHEGKNAFMGARGSSALEAGLDTVLNLVGQNIQEQRADLETTKQCEEMAHPKIHLRFVDIEETVDGIIRRYGKFPTLADAPEPKPDARQVRNDARTEALLTAILEMSEATEDGMLTRQQIIDGIPPGHGEKSSLDTALKKLSGNDGPLAVEKRGKILYYGLKVPA